MKAQNQAVVRVEQEQSEKYRTVYGVSGTLCCDRRQTEKQLQDSTAHT